MCVPLKVHKREKLYEVTKFYFPSCDGICHKQTSSLNDFMRVSTLKTKNDVVFSVILISLTFPPNPVSKQNYFVVLENITQEYNPIKRSI